MLRARPDDPGRLLFGTTFGLLTRDGADAGWEAICSEAVGYDERNNPVIHWHIDGALFAGSLKGLFVSRDDGCSWAPVEPFTPRGITDIRSAPWDPGTLFVTSGKSGGVSNGLYRSTDGVDFTATALEREELMFTGIRFAPSAPATAYVSAWWYSPTSTARLFRSTDRAETFEEIVPTTPAASGFTVLAVAPDNVDLLLAGAHDGTDYVLLRSIDGGATFSEVARDADREFRDAIFSPDGQRVWVASGFRLYHSVDGGATFASALPPKRTGCANGIDGTLYVCGSTFLDGWALSTVDGGVEAETGAGVPLDRVFSFWEMHRKECPAGTPGEDVCKPLWPALALLVGADPGEFPIPPDDDGGTPTEDAGTPGDGGVDAPKPPTGCGCASTGGGGLPILALLLVASGRRRLALLAAVAAVLTAFTGCGPVEVADPGEPDPSVEVGRTRPHRVPDAVVRSGASHTFELTPLEADDHGDDLTAATTVTPEPLDSGTATLESPGDRDVLTFLADTDHVYRIVCTRLSAPECNVRVMNVAGLPVASDLNGGDGLVLYEFNGGGTFFVELGAGSGTGTVEWSIEDLWHDDHDDSVFTATPMLANGAWVTGNLETPTDRDHLAFAATLGRVYRISCQPQTLPNCHLRLFDPLETLLASDLTGQEGELLHEASADALLSFQVRAPHGETGTYLVKVEELGTDDFGDSAQTAASLPTNGAPVAGRIESPGDADWFRFFAAEGQALHLSGSGIPVEVSVIAPDQTTIVSSGELPRTFTPASSGIWYVQTRSWVPGATGDYALAVQP